jgi:hypothetical protein
MLRQSLVLGALLLSGCVNPNTREPPGGAFVKVGEVVRFPDFLPGLGKLYVQPSTMPIGPYYGYDRQGNLVCTVYMVPIRIFNDHEARTNLLGTRLPVDHVDLEFTSPHPGVPEPHYHIVLWHIKPEEEARLQ